MGVKQYGSGLGHKILLQIYNLLGYNMVYFVLNFIAFYYALLTPTVKKSLSSYYKHLKIDLTYLTYYRHVRYFAHSILDRYISRINPDKLMFERENKEVFLGLKDGGIVLLSHIGGWATAAHSLKADLPSIHIVMRDTQKNNIKEVEKEKKRKNESGVKIIDLNNGAIAANIQIANALMANEVIAMMADRVLDSNKTIDVTFLGTKVPINRNPFDIAYRFKKKLVATFVINIDKAKYKLVFREIKLDDKTLQEIAQEYMNILEEIIRLYPNQWYNFYDFFNQNEKGK